MPDNRTRNRKRLQSLLRELFQFDHADLDFGIYRILNYKRDDIERFIKRDLLDAVDKGLAHFRTAERQEIEAQLAKRRAELGADALDDAGALRPEIPRTMPIAQDYIRLRQQLQSLDVAEETEAQVFNDLWRFFSRYYDDGDFLSKPRYSSREAKFCVPYNGEEVMLYWANRDQYYVKTSERFTDYRFAASDYTVWFRLERADVPQDNVKGNKRYFVLRPDEPLAYEAESKTLTISMEYRPLTEEEEARYLELYNAQQTESSRRKTLDRSALCVALEAEIVAGLVDPDLKAHLAAVAEGRNASTLGQHLNRYTARNTMDYFVHKDLGGFLRRELDFFLKNEVLRIDDVIGDKTGEVMAHVIARMRVVREIAERIISFLAQIESFQKRLFEKKKFVVQTDYCITLDRVPEAFYPEILANQAQLDEWRSLYNVDTRENDLFWQGEVKAAFLRRHPYVMVDTAFFADCFKAQLLASVDDLGRAIDGLLIHGENLQALNLLRRLYSERVKCVYVDPPYNTGNDEFLYKDNYRHSSWLTMMADRVVLARELLAGDGVIFVSIDDNELHHLLALLADRYGEGNFINNFMWFKGKGKKDRHSRTLQEYIPCFAKSRHLLEEWSILRKVEYDFENPDDDPKGPWYSASVSFSEERSNPRHPYFYSITSPSGRVWTRQWFEDADTMATCIGEGDIYWGSQPTFDNVPRLKIRPGDERSLIPENVLFDRDVSTRKAENVVKAILGDLVQDETISRLTPKHPNTLEHIFSVASSPSADTWLLDFFAGSGTTAHAAMNLATDPGNQRKYVLVEAADYFTTVLKPRIQRLVFSANWKNGVAQDCAGRPHMFKYQRIESYEDALNNIRVRPPKGAQRRLLYDEFGDYQLHYMLDFETRDSPSLLAQEAFDTPFDYTLKIQRGHESPEDTKVDLVETFHYLIGMHVRRLESHEHQDRRYVVSRGDVRSEHGVEKTVVIWRDVDGLDLNVEADWANQALLDEPVDRVYVNGPSHIAGAQPLEITFRQLMEPDRAGGRRAA